MPDVASNPISKDQWLERALPVVRTSFNNGLVAVFKDCLIILSSPRRSLPTKAVTPRTPAGLKDLTRPKAFEVVSLEAVEKVCVICSSKRGPIRFRVHVRGGDRERSFLVSRDSVCYLARALMYLLGSRLELGNLAADPLLFPTSERICATENAKLAFQDARHAPENPTFSTPFRSTFLSASLRLLGLLLMLLPAYCCAITIISNVFLLTNPDYFLEIITSGFPRPLPSYMRLPYALYESYFHALRLAGVTVEMAWWLSASFPGLLPLFALVFASGAFLFRSGMRIGLPLFDEFFACRLGGPYVLFLRPFDRDNLKVPRSPSHSAFYIILSVILYSAVSQGASYVLWFAPLVLLPWLFRFLSGRETSRFEEHLSFVVRQYGPLIAVGRPGERIITAGALRKYLPPCDWKDYVSELITKARMTVLLVGFTESTWWEFKRCVEVYRSSPERLLLMLDLVAASKQQYEELRLLSWDILPKPLPLLFGCERGFMHFDKNWNPAFLPVKFKMGMLSRETVDYERSLAPFLAPSSVHWLEPYRSQLSRSAPLDWYIEIMIGIVVEGSSKVHRAKELEMLLERLDENALIFSAGSMITLTLHRSHAALQVITEMFREYLGKEQRCRLILSHGSNRLVLKTDTPVSKVEEYLERIAKSQPITKRTTRM